MPPAFECKRLHRPSAGPDRSPTAKLEEVRGDVNQSGARAGTAITLHARGDPVRDQRLVDHGAGPDGRARYPRGRTLRGRRAALADPDARPGRPDGRAVG